jgi:ELWxxDGT repeat protein
MLLDQNISDPMKLTKINNTLFFRAKSGSDSEDLWKVDNSTGKPVRVLDPNSGDSLSYPNDFQLINGIFYFGATSNGEGTLWKIDNANGIAVQVKDSTGAIVSNPKDLTIVNGSLFLNGKDSTSTEKMWKIDGGGNTLQIAKPTGTGLRQTDFVDVNGSLFFRVSNGQRNEIWKIDSATNSPVMVGDIASLGNMLVPQALNIVNNDLYFCADTPNTGVEIWKIDSATKKPILFDIEPGVKGSGLANFLNLNGTLYFTATTGPTGNELWKIDNATGKPVIVKDIETKIEDSSPGNVTTSNGVTYFTAASSIKGAQLWKFDSAGNAVMLELDGIMGSANPSNLYDVNGTLYFRINPESNTRGELWTIDNSTGKPVRAIDPEYNNGPIVYPSEMVKAGNTLYFSGYSEEKGYELWKADSSTGNKPARVIESSGLFFNRPIGLSNADGTLYFCAYDADGQFELRTIDSNGKSVRIAPLSDETLNLPANFIKVNGTLYLSATSTDHGTELWKIGADNKPTLLEIATGKDNSDPANLTNVNGTLYFTASNSTNGTELWKIGADGNPARVSDIETGAGSSTPTNLTNVNGTLYFSATNSSTGIELWKIGTDGNPARVNVAGGNLVDPGPFVKVNNTFYFAATNQSNGAEIWKIGTDGNLVRVTDIETGVNSSYPTSLTNVNGTLYFTATNSTNGAELWKLDQNDNPVLVRDIQAGAGSSSPSILGFNANALYFSAETNTGGRQLWTLDLELPTVKIASDKTSFKTGETANVTFTFNKVPTGFDNSDIAVTGGTLGTATVTSNPLVYTAKFTPTTNTSNLKGEISIAADKFMDKAGNGNPASNAVALSGNTTSLIDPAPVVPGTPTPDPVTPTPDPTNPVFGISLDRNVLKTDVLGVGVAIATTARKAGTKVSEIGLLAVDDASGKIGDFKPGDAGYLKAALGRSQSILSTLDGGFFAPERREVALKANSFYQMIEIEDGSIADAKQQLAEGKTPKVAYSMLDGSGHSPIQFKANANNDGYQITSDKLVLDLVKLSGTEINPAIGARSQSAAEGRTIDLSEHVGESFKVDIGTKSDAEYSNQIGFYEVEDEAGTIKRANGTFVKPGDADYAKEAIQKALVNSQLQANKTDIKEDQTLAGGKIYAPVVVAQGTLADFLTSNPTNGGGKDKIHAYFNYVGANSDKVDHFRLLGDNTFGVEDLYGGGDKDFNDVVIKMNVKR